MALRGFFGLKKQDQRQGFSAACPTWLSKNSERMDRAYGGLRLKRCAAGFCKSIRSKYPYERNGVRVRGWKSFSKDSLC